MKVLVADDEPDQRTSLAQLLQFAGYAVELASNGSEALTVLNRIDAPDIALLDWGMPVLDGPSVCRTVRSQGRSRPPYLILLTARSSTADVAAGLDAGADDYLVKPAHPVELRARLVAAARIVVLQQRLADRVAEVEAALARVQRLEGLLPICAWCRRVRDGAEYWRSVEGYLEERTGAKITHGICPECSAKVLAEGEV